VSESASGGSVEDERIEVRLRLLKVRLAGNTFRFRVGDERTDRKVRRASRR
jgi:hypothetical protein